MHQLAELKGHIGAVTVVKYNHGGDYIISGSSDKTIKIWNPKTQFCLKTYAAHGKSVMGICVSKDNAKFVSASQDRSVFLWDVSSGITIRRFSGHDQFVNDVAINDEGSVIASASYDASVRLWDTRSQSRAPIQILSDFKDDVSSVNMSESEIIAASVDGCVRIYDIRVGELICDSIGAAVTSAVFSSDGQCFLASSLDGMIRLIDKGNGQELCRYTGHLNKTYKISSCFNNSDSKVISGSEDGKVYMWDLIDGTMLSSFTCHSKPVSFVSHHPTEDEVVSCSADSSIKTPNPSILEKSLQIIFKAAAYQRHVPAHNTFNRLIKSSNAELQAKCKSFGLMAGKKQDMAMNILSHLEILMEAPAPTQIISIDIGLKNLAFAHLDISGEIPLILDWKRLTPNYPVKYNALGFARETHRLVKEHFMDATAVATFIIERQTATSASWSKKGTPLTIQHCLILEALISSHFSCMGKDVESVFPRSVAAYFNIDSKGKFKKRDSIALVDRFCNSGAVSFVNNALINSYEEEKKKDDLSDALLIGLAYAEWRRNSAKFAIELQQEAPKTSSL